MKNYPSIQLFGKYAENTLMYTFDKLDGSNLRFEWTRKKGWYKFGTRTRLFDHTDPVFASAIPLWQNTTGLALEQVAHNNKWNHLLAFAEFWGDKSFAGLHDLDEPHKLSLFDICINKKGLSGPKEFLEYCGNLETSRYLGQVNWTSEYVASVKRGEIKGVTFEGVVGKAGHGHTLIMAKAKTGAWIDAIRGKFDEATATKILN